MLFSARVVVVVPPGGRGRRDAGEVAEDGSGGD